MLTSSEQVFVIGFFDIGREQVECGEISEAHRSIHDKCLQCVSERKRELLYLFTNLITNECAYF